MTAWQVKFKTIDVHGDPSAYVTTVIVPDAPWTGSGPRPLLSYQTAQDGISTKCAPSYALRTGLASGNSGAETIAMALALNRGWALTVPDYEGPRSEFLGAKGEARGVIDGVRAALRFDPAGFPAGTPVGLTGYSGGALASTLGAQLQPRYAPKLKLAGVALGGVPADIGATMRAFSGSPFGGAVPMGFAAADRSYPEANVEQYLNEAGLAAMEATQDDCIADAVARHPFARVEDLARDPAVFDSPPVVALLRKMSPLWFKGTPAAPVYEYHAVLDELAPIGPARALVDRFCAAGVQVQQVEDLVGEHITELVTGYPGALHTYRTASTASRRRATANPASEPPQRPVRVLDQAIHRVALRVLERQPGELFGERLEDAGGELGVGRGAAWAEGEHGADGGCELVGDRGALAQEALRQRLGRSLGGHQHQAPGRRVRVNRLEEGAQGAEQERAGVAVAQVARQQVGELGRGALSLAVDERVQEPGEVAEVLVDDRARDPGGARDAVDRDLVEALSAGEALGLVEDLLAALCGAHAPRRGRSGLLCGRHGNPQVTVV